MIHMRYYTLVLLKCETIHSSLGYPSKSEVQKKIEVRHTILHTAITTLLARTNLSECNELSTMKILEACVEGR